MSLLLEYRNDDVGAAVVFDDDGKTSYAYLIVNERVVGDVWLYNVGEPPRAPEWPDHDKMPFANSAEYASEERFEPIDDPAEIALDWVVGSKGLERDKTCSAASWSQPRMVSAGFKVRSHCKATE